MKPATKKLLEKVDAAHDWELGQTFGGGGTILRSTDVCRACGLRRKWFEDRQNGVRDRYSFENLANAELSLREALSHGCNVREPKAVETCIQPLCLTIRVGLQRAYNTVLASDQELEHPITKDTLNKLEEAIKALDTIERQLN